MTHQTASTGMLALALLCCPVAAMAANPFGSAVAGAPSLFVLAVAEARGENKETRAETQDREPRQEVQANASDRGRPASVQAPSQRPMGGSERADERKLSLR
jgi:hypothetical protein